MEWIGIFGCMLLVLCYSSYPGRVRSLERKLKKMKKKEESTEMSRIISKLAGKKCQLTASEIFSTKIKADIVDVDEEWVQLKIVDKKGNEQTKIIRIDCISEIDVAE